MAEADVFPKHPVSLDDKYLAEHGHAYMTGTQALVLLTLLKQRRDQAAGLHTAGFISGYRGSPLGGLDKELWRAATHLKRHNIVFQPGVNEDLAATAVWGSQQVNAFPGAKYDGVFGLWYGKGPGVDRCGDVFKHASFEGTSKHGGVLVLAGDDHAAKSSTVPHQSEHAFVAAMIPVLNPAGLQDYLSFGLFGWALSRYAGVWVAMICDTDNVESAAVLPLNPQVSFQIPDYPLPPDGLNLRVPDNRFLQETRLMHDKLYAGLAFAKLNKIDKIIWDSPNPRLGIITTGKAYLDVRQAFDDLGITEEMARDFGIRLYKVGMSWPLERDGARAFAEGLEQVLVVEEKRAIIENQLKEQLYNWREDVRPLVVGKFDENRQWNLPSDLELTSAMVARAIANRLQKYVDTAAMEERLAFIEAKTQALAADKAPLVRQPFYCSGCPHNTSTKVPEGSRASAGIGCHYMALSMDRSTFTTSHMGGEGVPWVGQAPFTSTKHIFQNLGDGTYYHSGLLAIRAAVAAGVNITYKILYNDAVAMTGGQPVDGPLTPWDITRQVQAEGVAKIIVVTDEPDKYPIGTPWATGVEIRHRERMDETQRELRDIKGCTILLYDQTCAAEKRRRRKRGQYPDPAKRAFINDRVCEGCGDCSKQSNCISIQPLATEFGNKRQVDQSSCNKDFSCVDGFCPSFVTVYGGQLRHARAADGFDLETAIKDLPTPTLPQLDRPYDILVTGVGGTGVITIGAVLGFAAHIAGLGVSNLDVTGLAQKGGAVMSHVRLARSQSQLFATRIARGNARLVIGCDLVVSASEEVLRKTHQGTTKAVVNDFKLATAAHVLNPDRGFETEQLKNLIEKSCGAEKVEFLDATTIATQLLGDSIATNLFMLGYVWQKGLIPLPLKALEQAIIDNGVSVKTSLATFRFGRLTAQDRDTVLGLVNEDRRTFGHEEISKTLAEKIDRRASDLVKYQNQQLAERYQLLVKRIIQAEKSIDPQRTRLSELAADLYYRFLAYKDEYEVARLYSEPEFQAKIARTFENPETIKLHLAPPILTGRDRVNGRPRKIAFGRWIFKILPVFAKMKFLRGTALDPFGFQADRRQERQLILDFEQLADEICQTLKRENYGLAIDLFQNLTRIRGYGEIKHHQMTLAKTAQIELLNAYRNTSSQKNAEET